VLKWPSSDPGHVTHICKDTHLHLLQIVEGNTVTFMKSALFLMGLQHILFFSFKANYNYLKFDCFYVLPD